MSGYTGGPAFPISEEILRLPNPGHAMGMTLRDYSAAKAMQGMYANDALLNRYGALRDSQGIDPDDAVSMQAYAAADAMLAERAK